MLNIRKLRALAFVILALVPLGACVAIAPSPHSTIQPVDLGKGIQARAAISR